MKNKILYVCILYFIFHVSYFILHTPCVHAANITAEGIAIDIQIEGKNIVGGSIISLSDGKYKLSSVSYDGAVFGVVTDNPAVAFKNIADKGKYSVVSQGKAVVRVSSINGNIKTGDLITTSSMPGVGQKSTENGYVIGVAEEDYASNDKKKVGTIFVTLHLNFGMVSTTVRENLIASIKNGARAPFTSPLNALRYLTAGVIAILSFAGGFWFFGRISSHGVEAIGRNPLARRFILLSVGLNVLITIAVMGLGVALAYIILVI
jgi:F0F1-type ATP synthase membrane subunit c/vacuolar-type H+-ATPase subunit K